MHMINETIYFRFHVFVLAHKNVAHSVTSVLGTCGREGLPLNLAGQ